MGSGGGNSCTWGGGKIALPARFRNTMRGGLFGLGRGKREKQKKGKKKTKRKDSERVRKRQRKLRLLKGVN